MSNLSLCMGSVVLAGTETGQSSVRDWLEAVAAAGYQFIGPLYSSASDHSPSKDDLRALIEKAARNSAKSATKQLLPRK
jgi:hypothetical protein